jgi:hypothetical protein
VAIFLQVKITWQQMRQMREQQQQVPMRQKREQQQQEQQRRVREQQQELLLSYRKQQGQRQQ